MAIQSAKNLNPAEHSYPEIETLNLEEVEAAMLLGHAYRLSILEEFKPEFLRRMILLRKRLNLLQGRA